MSKKNNEILVTLKFKDNDKFIRFDIKKNTVFYGLNGHGKTRALKSIELLIKLCKEKDLKQSINIVKELNLSHLDVNGVSYDKLLLEDETEIIHSKGKFIVKFIRSESIIEMYLSKISELCYFTLNNKNIFPISLIEKLHYLEERGKAISLDIKKERYTNIFMFEDWILEGNVLFKATIRENKIPYGRISDELNLLVEQLMILNMKLDNNFEFSQANLFENNKWVSHTQMAFKDKLINELSVTEVVYIATEKLDVNLIIYKIQTSLNSLKDEIYKSFFDSNFEETITRARREIKETQKKVLELNRVLINYTETKVYLGENDMIFEKKGDVIQFSKLSSGEQRIIFIFMMIIFNDADIYLIDEPEISLSIDYQNKIVNDLRTLTKNKILKIATHAPFIFEDFNSLYNSEKIEV